MKLEFISRLHRGSLLLLGVLAGTLAINGCELVDPTEVNNPQITDEALRANANGGTTALVSGMRRGFSDAARNSHIIDVVSDNYFNTASFISNDLDRPSTVKPIDLTLPTPYNTYQTLNALGKFGLEVIIPTDNAATNDQKAEVHFYRGMALVILSELFSAFPIEEKGPLVTSRQATTIAIDHFNTAATLTTNANMRVNIRLALARAYRLNGDKAKAAAEAAAALALPGGATYAFIAPMDAAQLTNTPQSRIVALNDLQPLPRLDFLDPKYTTTSTGIPMLKVEEAHLILAEIALSNNDLVGAKASLKSAITVARGRAVATYNDRDPRTGRPNDPTYTVKAGPDAPAIAGLIQRRGGTAGTPVNLYAISGTSLTTTGIDNLTTRTELIKALYLARQEIFFLEGRRMSDLGIRLPVSDRQINTNANVVRGRPGTAPVIPDYLSSAILELDAFTVDATNKVVTIKWDLNQMIANNIAQVSPFQFQ